MEGIKLSEIINENVLGATKGTSLEETVAKNFQGESMETGLYLAMARQAQREGYPVIALVLESIAMDEAWHAARFAELNGLIGSTKENLLKMLDGEIHANRGKRNAAVQAKQENLDEAHDVFDESSRDEARHANALRGLLDRYFS
jgi:rubrerythrin